MATGIGIVTFLAANLLALPQTNDRRQLGYSSIAQTGLVLVVLGQQDILGDRYLFIAGGLLFAHSIAKAGLYWLSGLIAGRELPDWAALRSRPLLIFAFVTFIAMLSGLPPFPGFYAKWELVRFLAGEGRIALLALILLGALIEAGYLFAGSATSSNANHRRSKLPAPRTNWRPSSPPLPQAGRSAIYGATFPGTPTCCSPCRCCSRCLSCCWTGCPRG